MPLSTWNFKGSDPKIRLLGPTAQDFYDAFRLGTNDLTIVSTNLHGVALAAIQGLHQVVQEKDARIVELDRRLAQLETLVKSLATKQ